MTVKVIGSGAALETGAPAGTDENIETSGPEQGHKPVVYVQRTEEYSPDVRYSTGSRKKTGFTGVLFAQLVMTALIGAGFWAASVSGFGQAAELCERLVKLFR